MRLLSFLVSLTMLTVLFSANAFAAENQSSEVDLIIQKMQAAQMDGIITETEQKNICNNTDYSEKALASFEAICQKEAEEALSGYELICDGSGYACDVINLKSGGQIIIQSEAIGLDDPRTSCQEEAVYEKNSDAVWKAYGDYSYKTTVTIISLGYCTAVLKSNYKLNKNGITLTGKSSDLTTGIGSVEALKYGSYYEKKSAGKGNSCKLLGKYKYKVTVPVLGVSVGTYYEKMRQTLKCVDISTKNKKVKVKLSVKAWKDDEW